MCVAEPSVAAAQQHDTLAGHIHVGKQRRTILGEDLRPHRNLDHHIRRARPGAVCARAIAALPRAEMLRVAEVDERVQVGHRLEDDVAALAAIAAVRAAELDELLAAECDHAIAAIAGAQMDLGLVEKLHRLHVFRLRSASNENGGRLAPTPV